VKDIAKRISREEKKEIIEWIKGVYIKPTIRDISVRYGISYQAARRLIAVNDLKEYCRPKRRESGHKPLAITNGEIKKLVTKRKAPYKRVTKKEVLYCGNWDKLAVLIDAQGKKIKWVKRMIYDLPNDVIITAKVSR